MDQVGKVSISENVSFWESLGNPKFIVGPMVDQSDLAFRLLSRRYGADLCYTPMLHSRLFVEQQSYRTNNFQTCREDSPVIAQFCGDSPDMIGRAAEMIGTDVNAVDINFGCPQVSKSFRFLHSMFYVQGIAKRGHYGSFLLQEPDLVESIVQGVVNRSPVPVTCKIRKVDSNDMQSTLNLARRIEAAGCSALCLHGRTRGNSGCLDNHCIQEEKGQMCGTADWDIISRVKQTLRIPVIANGGIETREDALRCLEITKADSVMSAEAILEYPALFNETAIDVDRLVAEYIELAKIHKTNPSFVKAHLFHSLYSGLQTHTDLREKLGKGKSLEECEAVSIELRERRINFQHEEKFGWYRRYRQPINPPKSNSRPYLLSADSMSNPLLSDCPAVKRPRTGSFITVI